jgi:hypothetical protein
MDAMFEAERDIFELHTGIIAFDGGCAVCSYLTETNRSYLGLWIGLNHNLNSGIESMRTLSSSSARMIYTGDVDTHKWISLNIEVCNEVTITISAATRNKIGVWYLNNDNDSLSYNEIETDTRIQLICTNTRSMTVASIENCGVVIRNKNLEILDRYLLETSAESSLSKCVYMDLLQTSVLLFSNGSKVHVWEYTNGTSRRVEGRSCIYSNHGASIVTAINIVQKQCILGYSDGKIIVFRVSYIHMIIHNLLDHYYHTQSNDVGGGRS